MSVKTLIKHSEYHDSVSLMVAARDLARLPGVQDASIIMGTEANKNLLKTAGLLTPEAEAATPNDLVIAVSGPESILGQALAEAEKLILRKTVESKPGEVRPRTMRTAVKAIAGANVAVVSVAGRYAAEEAWEALRLGLHVLLFSDNVALEDEIALKQYASQNGLLMMGPGAGTAILNGVALGFANAILAGPVGIVSAAGTGLQEVSTLLAKQGVGITQGIGTGGRDLKEDVGGIMMLDGLKALQSDPATKVILLVSKPPSASVVKKIMDQVSASDKPAVICFLGGDLGSVQKIAHAYPAQTLQAGALLAARLATAEPVNANDLFADLEGLLKQEEKQLSNRAAGMRGNLAPGQKYLRALFSGGTLCYEAQVIWRDLLPDPVLSNAPLEKSNQLPDSTLSQGHTAVDLGEEEFTVGRPHPMLDNDLRIRRLFQEAGDPETAVILLDVVLGYGAHPDPASELGPAIRKAIQSRKEAGGDLLVITSVTGTELDPQRLSRQVQALESAGAVVCDSNAAAARLAANVVCMEKL